jgi:hypothetical protein
MGDQHGGGAVSPGAAMVARASISKILVLSYNIVNEGL